MFPFAKITARKLKSLLGVPEEGEYVLDRCIPPPALPGSGSWVED